MTLLEGCLSNSTTGKRNIDKGSLMITNKERLKRIYFVFFDIFLVEFDRRVTDNDVMHNLLKSSDSALEK